MARNAARNQRMAEAQWRRDQRERIRAIKAAERATALAAKEAKQRYLEERIEEVEDLNNNLEEFISGLNGILEHTLSTNDMIDFDSLRIKDSFKPFNPPQNLSTPLTPPVIKTYTDSVKKPVFFGKIFPQLVRRYETKLKEAEEVFKKAHEEYLISENNRKSELDRLRKEYDKSFEAFKQKVSARDAEVDELKNAYFASDPEAVVTYNSMVLERSSYPEDFPQEFRIAYIPESKQLVVDYELPNPEIIPKVEEYKYVKSKDLIDEKPRKTASIKELYQNVVASVALRTVHEIFEADQANVVSVVVFNGFVQTIDPATGKDIRPYLISVRVTKNSFMDIDLSRIDKAVCLRNLGAQVSPRPNEVQPVKPIVDFEMVDRRYVEQSDILADLESRPNLMDLNPFEFENLVANLFFQIGLETKLTRSSKDGGVDVVAYDTRPVLGGKVVIQAKRYKNTVGVSAVRDLYGTMMNEGANKGILVTTSGYGPDAFEFSKDKPIELMDGGQLLYLLDQAGVKTKIIFPEDNKIS
jgi:restriction system protein